jgi:hypothetical protein
MRGPPSRSCWAHSASVKPNRFFVPLHRQSRKAITSLRDGNRGRDPGHRLNQLGDTFHPALPLLV